MSRGREARGARSARLHSRSPVRYTWAGGWRSRCREARGVERSALRADLVDSPVTARRGGVAVPSFSAPPVPPKVKNLDGWPVGLLDWTAWTATLSGKG